MSDVTLTLAIHARTGRAILVSETGEADKASWVPLSQSKLIDLNKTASGFDRKGQSTSLPLFEVTMPEWLATDKGLV